MQLQRGAHDFMAGGALLGTWLEGLRERYMKPSLSATAQTPARVHRWRCHRTVRSHTPTRQELLNFSAAPDDA
jgi:hypothetical protein